MNNLFKSILITNPKSKIRNPTYPYSQIKSYICAIILKGCLALSNQTERQAEIKPMLSCKLYVESCKIKLITYNSQPAT